MPDLVVTAHLTIPESELRLAFVRASGPGGQNVNKVATKAVLRWNPSTSQAVAAGLSDPQRDYLLRRLAPRLTSEGEVMIIASRHRTQRRNRADALGRLAALVRHALQRQRPRTATKPTKASVRRRRANKEHRSRLKATRQGGGSHDH